MIVSIWVFFMLGYETPDHPGAAYVQIAASPYMHDVRPDVVEHDCEALFHDRYPDYVVCDSGWCRQQVQVMGA